MNGHQFTKNNKKKSILFIPLVYLFLGLLWIFGSDYLMLFFNFDLSQQFYYQAFKGTFYILITSILLYFLIRHNFHYLIRNEEQFRAALTQSPYPIVIHSEEGEFRFINQIWTDITGYSPEELPTIDTWLSKAYGTQGSEIKKNIEKMYTQNKRKNEGEYTIKTKSGEERVWEFSTSLLGEDNKGKRLFITIAIDITERKQIEKQIRESEELHRVVLSSISDAVFITNEKGDFTYICPNVDIIFGHTDDEVYDKKNLKSLLPDFDDFISQLQEQNEIRNYEYIAHDKENRIHNLLINIKKVSIKNGSYLFTCRDISERKKIEIALQESEHKFRELVKNIPNIAVQGYSSEREVVFWNKASESLYGYTEEEALGQKLEDLIIPQTMREDVIQAIEQWIHNDQPIPSGELMLKHKNGSPVPIYSSHELLKNPHGSVELFCIDIDLSPLKASQHELEERNEFIELILENLPIGVAVHSLEHPNTQFMNRRFAEIHDWNDDVLNNRHRYFSHAFVNQQTGQSIMNQTFTEPPPDKPANLRWNNIEIQTEDQQHKRIDMECIMLERQNVAIFTVEDITDRIQREEERIRLVTAINQAAESIYITDMNGITHFVNPAFEVLTGFSRDEILGEDINILQCVQDSALHQQIWQTIREGHIWQGQIRCKRKNGSEFTAESTVSPVRDHNLEIHDVVFVSRDITHEEELEHQLRQSQKMESIGRLAGGIAHDFNNILMAILGYNEIAMSTLEEDNPLYDDLNQIKHSTNRAIKLTRQLLAFSRKQILQPEIINLNELILNIDKMLRRLIGEDIEYVTIPREGLWKVKADPGQLEQVVTNLVVNARDAMPLGGKITIETKNVELDEDYTNNHADAIPGEYVMLAITDTGTGIDPIILDQIFEPFFTTKEREKGTGLGLSTVHGIIKQSGGNIYVYSELGRGTTFKIYLPRVWEETNHKQNIKLFSDTYTGNETVLLVEDDEMVRKLIKKALQKSGYQTLVAGYASEASQLAENYEGKIHLLITDVIMPKMSGKELANQLSEIRTDIKVLFISGYTDNAIVHHGMLDGGIEFLQKPFTTQGLLKKVREILDE